MRSKLLAANVFHPKNPTEDSTESPLKIWRKAAPFSSFFPCQQVSALILRGLLVVGFLFSFAAWSQSVPDGDDAGGSFDAFSEERFPTRLVVEGKGIRFVLKGAARLSWRDLAGEGGLRHDSQTDTATLGTRSAHLGPASLSLAPRIESELGIRFRTELRVSQERVDVDAAWADAEIGPFRLEAGLHTPIVADDAHTRRATLSARAYTQNPEMHLAAHFDSPFFFSGASVAMMRPLAGASINDAASKPGTLSLLSYGRAAPFSGNLPVIGARVGVKGLGASAEAFGFLGQLSSEAGIDELRNRMAGFSSLPEFDVDDPREQDPTFWWTGGRIRAAHSGASFRGELILSQESLVRRTIGHVQVGYTLLFHDDVKWLSALSFFGRAEASHIFAAHQVQQDGRALRAVDPSQAITWDWRIFTLSVVAKLYRDLLWLSFEHTVIRESNGRPGRSDVPIENDETIVQIELRF
ncbi:MAG: hypothetical protein GY822_25250 [Deltaproteobacteria bacterium]|nr:hypothetical protein [Deltaproteobacteria bacterium]